MTMFNLPEAAVKSPLMAAQWFAKTALNLNTQTMTEYTEETTLAPVVLIDNSLAIYSEDKIEDLLQTVLSIYTAQYLVAVSYETEINGVKVVDILRKFSTQTSVSRSAAGSFGLLDFSDDFGCLPVFGLENDRRLRYEYERDGDEDTRSIMFDDHREERAENQEDRQRAAEFRADRHEGREINQDRRQDTAFNDKRFYDASQDRRAESAEARAARYFEDDEQRKKNTDERAGRHEGRERDKLELDRNKDKREEAQNKLTGLKSSYDNSNSIHTITDASNLTVGKMIDVKLVSQGVTVTVPVRAVLSPKFISPEDFVEMSGESYQDTSNTGRWRLWRSGAIGLGDYIFCFDLIEAHKKRMLADKTGTIMSSTNKKLKLLATAIANGTAAPNAVSTGIIIAKQTATALENKMGGNLNNKHIRDEYFSGNNTCMLIVVDTRREVFTLYQKGIADYKIYGFSTISKNKSKANGVDINSVLDAYKLGNAATL